MRTGEELNLEYHRSEELVRNCEESVSNSEELMKKREDG